MISKLRISNYDDYNEFRFWCLAHKPELLRRFYEPFLSYGEWKQLQQNLKNIYSNEYYDGNLIIAIFPSHENKYLYWHCPISSIRRYLETQCGYKKVNWFVKLFWKY